MKDYKLNGSVYEITLDNDKVVKVSAKWVDNSMKSLETDLEDVLLMWLEDNDYMVNEAQDNLDKVAKKTKVKVDIDTSKKKTPRERTQKPQPEKEFLIDMLSKALDIEEISNITIENKAKLITFDYKGNSYKLDLVQKRKEKKGE